MNKFNRSPRGPVPAAERHDAPQPANERPGPPGVSPRSPAFPGRPFGFFLFAILLSAAYALPLLGLVRHALAESLHSHLLLVPFVSIWLVWTNRHNLPHEQKTSLRPGLLFAVAAVAPLVLAAVWNRGSLDLSPNDHLALIITSYLGFLVAGGFLLLGTETIKTAAFPAFFLLFLIPLPDVAVHGLEQFLMRASADASAILFSLTGTPFYREGQFFQLPGILLEVARECSGIRSTWVLLIIGFLAGHLFLRSTWRRALLLVAIVILGILRNGARIVTIGLLCVHQGPHMADSPIHHRGGPYFFAVSLVPLLVLVWLLARSERPPDDPQDPDLKSPESSPAGS